MWLRIPSLLSTAIPVIADRAFFIPARFEFGRTGRRNRWPVTGFDLTDRSDRRACAEYDGLLDLANLAGQRKIPVLIFSG